MPTSVVVCMPQQGHMQRTLPVIEALARRGEAVHVFTGARFAEAVTEAGGRFEDLLAEGPVEAADATSLPRPSRYVTFAAQRADAITRRVAALRPRLLLHDTFAVIGRVVAQQLGIPAINICAGHAMVPDRTMRQQAEGPGVETAPACHAAVALLRERYGMANASPFSFLDGVSPHLNLYAEPPEFLLEADRAAFQPLAFFGSLRPRRLGTRTAPSRLGTGQPLRVFVSFGSVVWAYFPERAEARLVRLTEELPATGATVLVSTAGQTLSAATHARLVQAGFTVEPWVDQSTALCAADVFITHHGLNSTHEAIWHGVPMLSCPFFTDQPALAARCQALGLSVPLVTAPDAEIALGAVAAGLAALAADAEGFAARLATARQWEEAVIAGRDAVVNRILALA